MSQAAGLGGPTPRRSGRIGSRAPSTVAQSTVTNVTTGTARKRTKGALSKAKPRKSNAYGASGRAGAAEEQAVTATGFAQAFQSQRGGAVNRDDEEIDLEDDSVDELGRDALMSGGLNGKDLFNASARNQPTSPSERSSPLHERTSPVHERSSPPPRVPVRFSQSEASENPSDDDLALSLGDGSKSFGMDHEAGMLQRSQGSTFLRSSSLQPNTVSRLTSRPTTLFKALSGAKPTADKPPIEKDVNILLQKERVLLQRNGPPLPSKPVLQAISKQAPSFAHPIQPRYIRDQQPGGPRPDPQVRERVVPQAEPTSELSHRSQLQAHSKHRSPEVVKQWLGQVEPADDIPSSEVLEDEPEWPYLSLLKRVFWGFMVALGIYLLALLMSNTLTDPNRKMSLFQATIARISKTHDNLVDWIAPDDRSCNETKTLLTWLRGGPGEHEDHIFWSRMWKNHREYVGKFDELDSAIEKIKEDLPIAIVARRHPDEHLEITDDFWNALLSKVQSQSGDNTWDEFIRANEQNMDDLSGKKEDLSKPKTRLQIVSREEFITAMKQHYGAISTDVDRKIAEALKAHETQVKSLVGVEARKALFESVSLQSLAQTNILANYELNLMKPNYFSVGMGALVDPTQTSTTFDNRPASWARTMLGSIQKANSPATALTQWDEFGQCWCATPNPTRGYARVGISLPRYMFPKQVTIEHAPMTMSPNGDIRNAPRNIELWAETDEPIKQVYGSSHTRCLDPEDLRGNGYVCLGSFKYNIHAANHLQTFDLDAELTAPTSRIVMQVTSNWGALNTCVYRMRLHGEDAVAKPEYEVKLDD